MRLSTNASHSYIRKILPVMVLVLLMLVLATACPAGVRWTADGIEVRGTGLIGDAYSHRVLSDGSGGAIITWADKRNGQSDIYAQRVLANGTVDPAWTANGVEVRGSGLSGDAGSPQIIADGSGGAIITWDDNRAGIPDIYAQRVLANGTVDPAWPANGLSVCTDPDYQNGPQLASDGLGGAIITWPDRRSTTNYNIYAQRVLASGTVDPAWPANGLAVCTALPNGQGNPRITPDGSGGAIIAYEDGRSMLGDDIYAQRVLASGTVDPAWPVNGRAVCIAANGQFGPRMIPDGSGGAIITWEDHRSGPNPDVYAQRVLASGTVDPAWPVNGRAVCDTADEQSGPRITSDGSTGAVITWRDKRSGNYDVYAQRLLAGGTVDPAWPANGRAVCDAASNQYAPDIASDGSGGAIIVWEDDRPAPNYDIYAQRVLADGTLYPNWPASGLVVCGAVDDQFSVNMAADGAGGAIVAWEDLRSGSRSDIYAQRVSRQAPTVTGITPVAAPNGTVVGITDLAGTGFFDVGGVPVVILRKSGQPDVVATGVTVASPTRVNCAFDLAGAAPGAWDVVVTNPDGQAATLPGAFTIEPTTWYLAEGCTGGDFETFILVQNPGDTEVSANLTFMTSAGEQTGPRDAIIPAGSRRTFKANDYVTDWDVSTRVEASGAVICERAVYGNGRSWAHDSIGVTVPSIGWNFAEGCTDGGMETWILVQNPNAEAVDVILALGTSSEYIAVDDQVPANSRRSFRLNDYVTDYNVSTTVMAAGLPVVCERAMYGPGGVWAHDSIGTTQAAREWYLAEGSTDGGMETYVLIQAPDPRTDAVVDVVFQTDNGEVAPLTLQGLNVAKGSRVTLRVNDYVATYNVSTRVTATSGAVVCERAMYGNDRTWAHESIGAAWAARDWYLAEGCTGGDFETFILVQNPGDTEVSANLTFMTSAGEQTGPRDAIIPAGSRRTFKANDYVTDWDVSTRVEASGAVICERAVYGNGRSWAHDSIGYSP